MIKKRAKRRRPKEGRKLKNGYEPKFELESGPESGRPIDVSDITEEEWAHIERHIVAGPYEECWPYAGRQWNKGYGQIKFRGKLIKSHRLSYSLFRGRIPKGRVVRHLVCNNPACQNPYHLEVGTQLDNMRDRREKEKMRNHSVATPEESFSLPQKLAA